MKTQHINLPRGLDHCRLKKEAKSLSHSKLLNVRKFNQEKKKQKKLTALIKQKQELKNKYDRQQVTTITEKRTSNVGQQHL